MPFPIVAALSAASSLAGLFQKTPKVIPVQPTDVNAVTRDTLTANRALLPQAQGLASNVTQGLQNDVLSLVRQRIPGYDNLVNLASSRAAENLTNPYSLPADVQANLGRLSAERGISTGGRGQFQDFSALRDLGVNMLAFGDNRISQAQSLLSLVNNLAPQVNPVSPLAFLASPETAINADFRNKENAQAVAQAGANASAAASNARLQSISGSFGAFAPLLQNLPIFQASNPATTGSNDPAYTNPNYYTTGGGASGSKTFGPAY